MSKANVLILEDETLISLDIQKVLEKMPVNVVGIAKDSFSALELASLNHVDILISDIELKCKKDGIEVAQELQLSYGTQVIFITGHNESVFIKRASTLESSAYLLKPFREDELMVAVELIIDKFNLNTDRKMIQINEHHSYDKNKGILYLNEKEMYLSRNEGKAFKALFENINTPIKYEEFDIKKDLQKQVISNLNVKLKDIVIRDIKDEASFMLTFK